jgi:hypothetical protein
LSQLLLSSRRRRPSYPRSIDGILSPTFPHPGAVGQAILKTSTNETLSPTSPHPGAVGQAILEASITSDLILSHPGAVGQAILKASMELYLPHSHIQAPSARLFSKHLWISEDLKQERKQAQELAPNRQRARSRVVDLCAGRSGEGGKFFSEFDCSGGTGRGPER